MKKKLKEWKEEIKQPNKFKLFYNYVFDYLREDKKILCKPFFFHSNTIQFTPLFPLATEESITVWGMLGMDKRWPLYSKWVRYLEGKKSISRDTWRLFINFIEQYPKDLSTYDADGCWPSMIGKTTFEKVLKQTQFFFKKDEFVDWSKEHK